MIRTPAGQVRVKTVCHHCHDISLSLQYGKFGDHRLCLCELVFTAVRHKYAAGADRPVKHLHKPFLRTHIQIIQRGKNRPLYIARLQRILNLWHSDPVKIIVLLHRRIHIHAGLLVRPVRVEKSSRDIHDLLSPPHQHKPRLLGHCRDLHRLEILLCRIRKKLVSILRIHDDRHPLLRL